MVNSNTISVAFLLTEATAQVFWGFSPSSSFFNSPEVILAALITCSNSSKFYNLTNRSTSSQLCWVFSCLSSSLFYSYSSWFCRSYIIEIRLATGSSVCICIQIVLSKVLPNLVLSNCSIYLENSKSFPNTSDTNRITNTYFYILIIERTQYPF